MKQTILSKFKRTVSSILALTMTASITNVMPVSAEEVFKPYPYTLFAGSIDEGSITSTADNFCINGNAATNGTFAVAGNFNVNGSKTEHAGENIPIIFNEIDERFFSGDVEKHGEDYSYSELNINVTVPIEVQGDLNLEGNITLNTGMKALSDITLTGEVKNTNESVICSQTGDIFIDSQNVNLGGLVYAPCGTVTLKAQNLNLNNVIIIADKIKIDAPSVNANYSTSMGQFVGGAIATNNSNNGEISVDTIDPIIYAFGSFNEEEKAIDIEWYSNIEGSYEISESADNDVYFPLAEVSDFTTYRYHITDDFDTKYFKVKVTSEDKTAESVPFVVSRTDDVYSVDFLDSDGDGLADIYEELIGTDIENVDTDNDGLTDYQEVYITGTDPTKYDSVTEGVSDYDADNDNDGLSNGTEIELGTDPVNPDTDGDELSDGEEVNTYVTDPLKPDSDGDTLPDGDEPHIGLDPTNPETFGTPDEKYVSEQTIAADSEALSEINTEENPYELTIKYTGTGYAEGNIIAGESGYANTVGSDMELGTIAEFSFKDTCKMDKAVLYYNIKSSFIDNELGTYSKNYDELSGIKRLGVFTFSEEYNIMLPVVTEYDTESNTVYAEVDAQGTYFLVDYEKWLREWGVSAGIASIGVSVPYLMSTASTASTDVSVEKIEKADIVFSVDVSATSANNLGETPAQNLARAKNDIRNVAKNIFEKGEDIRFGVFGFTWKYSSNEIGYRTYLEDGSDWATDLDELDYLLDQLYIDNNYGGAYIECGIQDAASPIITRVKQYEYRDDADKYLFEYAPLSDLYIYSDGYLAATLCSYSALYDQLKRSSIRFSFVLDKYSILYLTELGAEMTGGETAFYCSDLVSDDISGFIYKTAKKMKNNSGNTASDLKLRSYISSLSLKPIVLEKPLTAGGKTNTDTDGFTDWEEVDSDNDLITYEFGDVHLPTYEECLMACEKDDLKIEDLVNVMKDKLGVVDAMMLFGKEILPLTSDPTCGDTDGDGLLEGISQNNGDIKIAPEDLNPLIYDGAKNMWKNHIKRMKENNSANVATKYKEYVSGESAKDMFERFMNENDLQTSYYIAYGIIGFALQFRDELNENDENLKLFLAAVKEILPYSPELGASLLNFVEDDKGQAYHSKPDTWQKFFGYDDMYDDVFRIASSMHYGRVDFDVNEQTYTLWSWKGDYWNLQSGAEVGLYKKLGNIYGTDHYDYAGMTVPMTLSLYNYYSSDNIIPIYNWAPEEEQWWITGFNSNEYLPDPNKMVYIASVDFSGNALFYEAIKNADPNKDYHGYLYADNIIFDDKTKTVWFQWFN
ncbi:protein of unknown function [Ruminococcus sp. YE71]|uniref:DUF4474 domain-containing protein n=1 Tax=unclassified Ruminococcus TaxID=2608920 RepID=UPI000884DA25|nr:MULTISPECIES: DUF4474 domain-containing protein [unclassified Ruminococcus]SDA32699.1 protein of unknown function [Ruminococcus sp. YE78]SFW53606.1 protein of unknown function [Ruminococcus sp. YE71]